MRRLDTIPLRLAALLPVCTLLSACASTEPVSFNEDTPQSVLSLQQDKGPMGLLGGTRVVIDKINGEEAGTLWSAGATIRIGSGPVELVVGAIEDTEYGVCVLNFTAEADTIYDIVADTASLAVGEGYKISASARGGRSVAHCVAERQTRPFTPLPSILKGSPG